jgi:hypothetical protein
MKMDRQRELFEPAKRITPPKPSIPRDIWQPTIMDWLAEHPNVDGPPALAD